MDRIAVIGFPKCGTMSMIEWLKKKYPDAEVSRPENIYAETMGMKTVEAWNKWKCVAITRDPVKRIKSGIQYWPELQKIYREQGIEGVLKGIPRYENVGFKNPIQQSNYDYYIKQFEKKHWVNVEVYRFEDMIKDKDFPHINESETKINLPESDVNFIKKELEKTSISY